MGVAMEPWRPRGGSGRARGGWAVVDGHARGERSANDERADPYSAQPWTVHVGKSWEIDRDHISSKWS